MKRRYKLLLIILFGTLITFVINNFNEATKKTLVSLGDGFSLGMTPYNVAGISFNDYLKDRLEENKDIKEFNNEFSINHLTSYELSEYIEENVTGTYTKKPIKQTLAKADIITISIGLDEFADLSLSENIGKNEIYKYITNIEKIISNIKKFYNKKLILIGLYPAYKFSQKDAIEVNNQLKIICGKYQVNFLDIYALSLNDKHYLEKSSYYLNYIAHKKIADDLYKMI